jgi:hypothetical protein
MKNTELYKTLKSSLTVKKLQNLSIRIIDAHKEKKESLLLQYADTLFPEQKGNQGSGVKLFVKLIKHIHPDKLAAIHRELDSAFDKKDASILRFYGQILSAEKVVTVRVKERYSYDFSEEYRYEDYNDVDSRYTEDEPEYGEEDFAGGEDSPVDFLSVLKREVLGNIDFILDAADLQSLEGELELRERGISDLEGLQYCRNLSSLDLCGNTIANLYEIGSLSYLSELYLADNVLEDIEPLKHLSNLQILDLSGNEIEDITPLLELPGLSFLDLRGNPVPRDSALRKLQGAVTVLI